MKVFIFSVASVFLIAFFSAVAGPGHPSKSNQVPGVIITFDDKYVAEWMTADSLFKKAYNWKATFFVSAFQKLSNQQKQGLLALQQNGHEIGFHGDTHLAALPFIQANSLEAYLQKDFTQLNPMRELGLQVTSFAYPSGSRNTITDSALLKQFNTLRGVTNRKSATSNSTCFYKGNRVVDGIGIEYKYRYFSEDYLLSLLQYAKQHNTVLIVYGHRPVPSPDSTKHEVAYATIKLICEFVKNNHMQFYKMSDLATLSNKN